jgi:hypothetical protein
VTIKDHALIAAGLGSSAMRLYHHYLLARPSLLPCRLEMDSTLGFTNKARSGSSSQIPLAWLRDIASLEERVSHLEKSNTQYQNSSSNGAENSPANGAQVLLSEETLSNRQALIYRTEQGESLSRSSPAIGLLATFARSEDEIQSLQGLHGNTAREDNTQNEPSGAFDGSDEEALFEIYQQRVHCRYPFLRLTDLRDVNKRSKNHWVGYFTNMVFSIGLLLGRNHQLESSRHSHQAFYRTAVTQYLSHVFAQPERLLHIQAYLLLAMHAIYSPSTERIISIASATMRYCVMAQLHLAEAEPEPTDVIGKVQIQMRRRVFWSAYALDRAVGTAFDLPFSIPDYQITVKLYANINDHELDERCTEAYSEDALSRPRSTSVSAALHVVYCRQIQSEILNTTLHRDFNKQFDSLSHWRLRVLGKLDRWKSLCHRFSDPGSITFTSSEWLHMIYNYSLAMLYQPTKSTITGPAGDWTVKSCVQACLIFRKFQRETAMSELWLGLVVQFKCGVALLYCFYATPPHLRSAAYQLPEVSEAVRACSIILSLLAERWAQSKCVRDSFDILSREIPLFESISSSQPSPRRMRQESSEALLTLLPQLENIIVHRNTIRMIKEMATEEFSHSYKDRNDEGLHIEAGAERNQDAEENDSPIWRTSMTGDIFQPVTPHFFQDINRLDSDGFDYISLGFPGEFEPEITF